MPFLRFFHVCGDNHENGDNGDDDDDHVEEYHFRRIVLHNRVIESWRKENEKAKEGPRHQGVVIDISDNAQQNGKEVKIGQQIKMAFERTTGRSVNM